MEIATIVNGKMRSLSIKLRVLAGMIALGYVPSGAMRTENDDDCDNIIVIIIIVII